MTTLLALILCLQDNPGQVIRKAAEAVEKLDLEGLKKLLDPKGLPDGGFTQELMDEFIKESKETLGKHFPEALKTGPAIAQPPKVVDTVTVEWRYPVEEGLISIRMRLRKIEGEWKVGEPRIRLKKGKKSRGVIAELKASPTDALKGFAELLEKGDYEGLKKFAPARVRDKFDADKVKKIFERRKKKAKGHWIAAVKKVPAFTGVRAEITEIDFGVTYKTEDGKIQVGVQLIKEKDRWVVRDVDVDLDESDN